MVHRVIPGRKPAFPPGIKPDEHGLIALGGEPTVDTLIEAYGKGMFPWSGEHPIPWYSPDPRLVLVPGQFHCSRSLKKLLRRQILEVRFDHDFAAMIRVCASTPRRHEDGTWITPNLIRAYTELHHLGIAHSVEVYERGDLCGGLYGLTFGRAFFGESMVALRPNASKVALSTLCRFLHGAGFAFIDCQAVTRHLLSLGARPWSRAHYLGALERALAHPSMHQSWNRLARAALARDMAGGAP